ncbi:MAG: GEVED domain-containing protein, partial [Bacteroidota bacterium]
LSWITDPTSSFLNIDSGSPSNGKAAQFGYTITYIRTSFNTVEPSCMRMDTAYLSYCCGAGPACQLALGGIPLISCGGVDNEVGPEIPAAFGDYFWSREDGMPLDNELFDVITGEQLPNEGPHPPTVIANPDGLTAINYVLTFILDNPGIGDTCSVDVRVFPGAISTPNISYPSDQALCQGADYMIQGPAEQPALEYSWSPVDAFLTAADTAMALPTVTDLATDTDVFVEVLDPSTGCIAYDTVTLLVTPVAVNAGVDDTFCDQGATIDIGASKAVTGYLYQWTSEPPTGVVFGDDTAPMTTATLPATTTGETIILYLNAINGLTPANCELRDSIILTAGSPTITIPPVGNLCTGGQVTIGPISPDDSNISYTWTGPGIVSGQGTSSIVVNATGMYDVTVMQGACSSTETVEINPPTDPIVDTAPAAPCIEDVTIGATNLTVGERGEWAFTWDNFSALTGSESDLSTITVRPTVETTYTLTARHSSGCEQTFVIVVPAAAYAADLPTTLNFCEGDDSTLPLNDFSSVAGSVVWTAEPTSAEAYLNSTTANEPEIDLSAAPAGQYTYTATVTYTGGCVSVASTRVNIGKSIANIAGLDREICEGECVQLGINRVSGISYSWSSEPEDVSLIATNFHQPMVCPTENTIYTLDYVDRAGCRNSDEVEVLVKPSPMLTVEDIASCADESTGEVTIDLNTAIVNNTGTTTTFWLDERALVAASNPVSASTTYYIQSESIDECTVIEPVMVVADQECDFPDNPPEECIAQPCHVITTDIYLGTEVNSGADEGVLFPNNLRPGTTVQLSVSIYNESTNDAFLTGWIDWNGDGTYADEEQIADATYDVAANNGTFLVQLPVDIPTETLIEEGIRALFRVSTDADSIMTPCGDPI